MAIVDEVAGGGFYAIARTVRRTLREASTSADRREPVVGWIRLVG